MGPKNSEKCISVQWDEVQDSQYAGFITHKEGSGSEKISWVSLHLGLTDYRTFVGTNLNPLWERFLVPSKEDTICCQHTSSPLGNGAIVETLDKKILVLRRSNNVGEFPGHFVFPGGHPEPQEIGIESHQPGNSLRESELLNKRVSEEMFDSIVREVIEEIGVPGSSLGNPLFIGISRREMNVRPAAFYFMTCTLHSDEIQKCYSSAQDGFESTQLYAVTLIDLENLTSKMPGCHQGGFALYKLMLEAAKDAR
ncbi:nudix hydrolase 9 isoform X2 [Syzygium oleosum]|uniref:nudix hydrolase 9 isoform X2 n=1 Tax=Syzygium oleosum TaxID=219896 RepID=UPI0024B9716E|nr:nudix hydrolase 9 isoform X2 [Syzygium oleosum]